MPSPNGIWTDLNGETDISGTITDKILKYCETIELQVIVHDNQLMYLSHARIPLIGNENKILYCNKADGGEIIFPDANATLNINQLTYTELDGNSKTITIDTSTIVRQFTSKDQLNSVVKRMMDSYMNYNAFYGVVFWDEPNYVHFDAIKDLMIAVHNAKRNTYIQQCLLPSYASMEQLGGYPLTVDYDTYINSYASICKETKAVDTISADYYPLELNKYKVGSIYNGYIDGLRTLAYYATKYNFDWKLCIQCFGQDKVKQQINDAKILWQTNIALSLGACSVDYYTYSRDTHGSYNSSIVDGTYTGGYTITSLYDSIVNNNTYLDNIYDLLLSYRYSGSILCQNNNTYTNSSSYVGDTSNMSITSYSAETLLTKLVDKSNNNMYCLSNIEKPCIMNESFIKDDAPIDNKVSFKINGASSATIYYYDSTSNNKIESETITAVNNTFTCTLKPAQTIYITLN